MDGISRVVVLGAHGMLGTDICQIFSENGVPVVALSSKNIDITDPKSVAENLDQFEISWLINCAAFTKVDACETEKDRALQTNGNGPKYLAQYCSERNIPLVHFSTDYIFDGTKLSPYAEDDTPNPVNYYGETKLIGEQNIQKVWGQFYIFRVQWLYGNNGNHFVKTILRLAQERPELKIVADQWGSPTWTREVAHGVYTAFREKPLWGIYNFASHGYTTWFEFAEEFLKLKNIATPILRVTTEQFPLPAKRPKNSRLDLGKFFSSCTSKPKTWQQSIKEFLL